MQEILLNATNELQNCKEMNDFVQIKAKYFGKKSYLNDLMAQMKNISNEEKKAYGQKINELKVQLEIIFNEAKERIEKMLVSNALEKEKIDISLPGKKFMIGSIHPLEKTTYEIIELFLGMGYTVAEGPEIESDEYNFEKLNLPANHPARDMQDSFYINANTLLRTHTSPVQVRTMLENPNQEIKIICPGKVYRRDADDPTHSHQFMQIEGLVLGKSITFSDLKGTLLALAKKIFGEERQIRLRPSYFPFTEPSVEVDVSCAKCDGKGCPICKHTGWIEVLGAGMVHNHVLDACGYDYHLVQGFAFGVGVERVTMLKYRIDDIRQFYTNNIRFLEQFKRFN